MKVVQSWDDGVVDDIRLADLLRRRQASATFNLNPGLHQAGRSLSWCYGDKEVWRLGRDELVEVYAGFEIANHSLSHPNLPDLSPADLEREVRDSRRILQAWFQQPVRGFCYPFGGLNPAVKEVVRAAGFPGRVAAICQWMDQIDELRALGADEVLYLYTGAGAALADIAMGEDSMLRASRQGSGWLVGNTRAGCP